MFTIFSRSYSTINTIITSVGMQVKKYQIYSLQQILQAENYQIYLVLKELRVNSYQRLSLR
jgi:hypothetical protein